MDPELPWLRTDAPTISELGTHLVYQAAASWGAPLIHGDVKQAFLRTLSRYPDDRELSRTRGYIEGAEDTTQGLRDLLWALLNTKEFIVNH